MTHGVLQINLNPPYMVFGPRECQQADSPVHYCSADQIRQLLLDLDIITDDQWSVRDMHVRIDGTFSASTLAKHGLEYRRPVSEAPIQRAPLKL